MDDDQRVPVGKVGPRHVWRYTRAPTWLLLVWNGLALTLAFLLWSGSCDGPLGDGDACGMAGGLAQALLIVGGIMVWLVGNAALGVFWLVTQRDATTSTMTIAALLVTGLTVGALGLTRLAAATEATDTSITVVLTVIGAALILLALRQARARRALQRRPPAVDERRGGT